MYSNTTETATVRELRSQNATCQNVSFGMGILLIIFSGLLLMSPAHAAGPVGAAEQEQVLKAQLKALKNEVKREKLSERLAAAKAKVAELEAQMAFVNATAGK